MIESLHNKPNLIQIYNGYVGVYEYTRDKPDLYKLKIVLIKSILEHCESIQTGPNVVGRFPSVITQVFRLQQSVVPYGSQRVLSVYSTGTLQDNRKPLTPTITSLVVLHKCMPIQLLFL